MMNRIVKYEYNNNINSQSAWKQLYLDYKINGDMLLREEMFRFRREAVLERKLEAAQRTIEAQERRIEQLEADVVGLEGKLLIEGSMWVESAS